MLGVERRANAHPSASDIGGRLGAFAARRTCRSHGTSCAFVLLIGRESRLKHSSHSPVKTAA
jgi:hypothetical protein